MPSRRRGSRRRAVFATVSNTTIAKVFGANVKIVVDETKKKPALTVVAKSEWGRQQRKRNYNSGDTRARENFLLQTSIRSAYRGEIRRVFFGIKKDGDIYVTKVEKADASAFSDKTGVPDPLRWRSVPTVKPNWAVAGEVFMSGRTYTLLTEFNCRANATAHVGAQAVSDEVWMRRFMNGRTYTLLTESSDSELEYQWKIRFNISSKGILPGKMMVWVRTIRQRWVLIPAYEEGDEALKAVLRRWVMNILRAVVAKKYKWTFVKYEPTLKEMEILRKQYLAECL